ncbi:hypothetical protein BD560DRAFT_425522 [Blakeslea trispora]|nr:hypothetical protein BD560DRAFT_425522 [Blakeslea trispora]
MCMSFQNEVYEYEPVYKKQKAPGSDAISCEANSCQKEDATSCEASSCQKEDATSCEASSCQKDKPIYCEANRFRQGICVYVNSCPWSRKYIKNFAVDELSDTEENWLSGIQH